MTLAITPLGVDALTAPDTGGRIGGAIAGDVSLSSAADAAARLLSPAPSDISLSADSAAAGQTAARWAADSSLSSERVVAWKGIVEFSFSTDTASRTSTISDPLEETSLSDDTVAAGKIAYATDASVSHDSDGGAFSLLYPSAALYPSASLWPGGVVVNANLAGGRVAQEISLSHDSVAPGPLRVTSYLADASRSADSTHARLSARASDTSTSTVAVVVHVQATGFTLRIREKAPLRLTIDVTTPAGRRARWGADDPKVENAPSALSFSTVISGGFEQMGCALQRDPARVYPDLEQLSRIQVQGPGRQVAWEGRLESQPAVAGDQEQITVGAVGYQARLDDDSSAREIFVDRDIGHWQGPSVGRQIQWLQHNPPVVAGSPSVGYDTNPTANAFPSLVCELSGAWTENQVIEAWYDAHGISIGELYAAWETNGAYTLTGGFAFGAAMFLASEDTGVNYDQRNPLLSSPGMASLTATAARPWALLQLWNDTVPGGKDGVNYDLFWTALGVFGRHGLPRYGLAGYQSAQGVLASDVIAYALSKWTPDIKYTTGPSGTIQPSSFVLPQLAFLDPTTVSAMIKQAIVYELLEWAIWEGPTAYVNARGARGRSWQARIGPAQLQDAGPQIQRLWNGVIVAFSDVSGVQRTVGPPGSGANQELSSLLDTDPENPANQDGIRRWATLTFGTSTYAGAAQVGQRFLAEQKLLDRSGQATLTGHVQDSHGILWPAWMVRAGDSVSFLDAADRSPRRIVHTNYDNSAKACTVQLDAPPDSMSALLERLSVVLAPLGMG